MPLVPTLCFLALLAVFLFIDLGVLNRKAHSISAGEAMRQTSIWVVCAMLFGGVIFAMYEKHAFGLGLEAPPPAATVPLAGAEGPTAEPAAPPPPVKRDPLRAYDGTQAVMMYATGYLLEMMLSLDNMMVIAIIMTYFKVPPQFQHRALFWGIIGAVALRGAMIGAGSALVAQFHWILYVFGGFLLLTAIKLLFSKDGDAPDLEKNLGVRAARAMFPVSPDYVGARFLTRINGSIALTPLMLALITIECADVIFAVDSIPAAFSATKDPFLVLTSNCFAILGLRAIYFAVAAITARFRFLKQSMILILAFIGVKMLVPLADHIPMVRDAGWNLHIGPMASLIVIAALMGGGVLFSIALPAQPEAATDDPESR